MTLITNDHVTQDGPGAYSAFADLTECDGELETLLGNGLPFHLYRRRTVNGDIVALLYRQTRSNLTLTLWTDTEVS